MAKSAEQRAKETGIHVLQDDWDGETARVRKDVDPALYKMIAGLTKRFDDLDLKFRDANRRQGDVMGTFDDGKKELSAIGKEMSDLFGKVQELAKDSQDSVKNKGAVDSPEDRLNSWEEDQKASESWVKELRIYFDKVIKLGESFNKCGGDTINKVRAQINATRAEMGKANDELNAIEAQIRSAVLKCEAIAVKQSKPEVAKAVRSFLKAFG